MISIVCICFLAGAVGGLLIGLIGAGMGPIIIPTMMLVLPTMQVEQHLHMKFAVATSLLSIICTALATVSFKIKKNSLNKKIFYQLLPGSTIGAILGSLLVIFAPSEMLKIVFALLLCMLGLKMILNNKETNSLAWPSRFKVFCFSGLIAFISNLIGISDGVLLVPFLKRYSVNLQQAIQTATALIVPVSLLGFLPLFITGFYNNISVPYSLGYVYLPAFFPIVTAGIFFSYLGAKYSIKFSENKLRLLFGFSIAIFGIKMLF